MGSLILIALLLCLLPCSQSHDPDSLFGNRKILPVVTKSATSYAVIFDAGSTGTRVHVFHFNKTLDLLPISPSQFEFYSKVKPGLSSYAEDPQEAAESIIPLLRKAEAVVPKTSRSRTPARLGATAGLRALKGDAAERILEAVRDLLENSSFEVKSDEVAIISGTQEGFYLWVTVNYLLGKLGEDYSKTVGVVDLGGGSVQMAYAISEADAAKAPNATNGQDPYVTKMYLKGTLYYIYVHSYLHYGKEASRAEILKVSGDSDNPCILAGFKGTYKYGNGKYKASALPTGSSFNECRNTVVKALKVNESCPYKKCTFGGIWNGGGGDGQSHLYLASSFYYLATDAGFADINKASDKVRIIDYKITAELACKTSYKEANSSFPLVYADSLPYLCMDLVYQYTLLVDGFGLDPWQEVTVVDEIKYKGSSVDASWALGSAIEAISSRPKFDRFMSVM